MGMTAGLTPAIAYLQIVAGLSRAYRPGGATSPAELCDGQNPGPRRPHQDHAPGPPRFPWLRHGGELVDGGGGVTAVELPRKVPDAGFIGRKNVGHPRRPDQDQGRIEGPDAL